jgi:hypothetical protein
LTREFTLGWMGLLVIEWKIMILEYTLDRAKKIVYYHGFEREYVSYDKDRLAELSESSNMRILCASFFAFSIIFFLRLSRSFEIFLF